MIQNETCEIYLNEIVMEEEIMEERSKEGSILQTKSNRGWIMKIKLININLQKLYVQRVKWRPHSKNALCGFFFVLIIIKMLVVQFFKSCVVSFVTTIHSMHLI